jgi:superfamily II DNA or RNA helicase
MVVTTGVAPGATVLVRGEEWQVTRSEVFPASGVMVVECVGRSELVRETTATFFSDLDNIVPFDPTDTRFVLDESETCRSGRLYIEALRRRFPLPLTDTTMRAGHLALVDDLPYQREPWRRASEQLQARLLIADSVGLGKTIEVGMLLAELHRRGRAGRVLAVVPRHILDQVQHELWCRFGFPMVRLDSEGIARVNRVVPVDRNPFTYFDRVIVSIDTLKSNTYRRHLERMSWDVVWVDESHKLMNQGTKNNELANALAPTAKTFLLTSATPHNGDNEAFARLVALLDPTAVPDPKNLDPAKISSLVLRRHKHSPDVESVVGSNWAARKQPIPVEVVPTGAEEAVFAELAATWVGPGAHAPTVDRLFPFTLLKAALSSPAALLESVTNRLGKDKPTDLERSALDRMQVLAQAALGAGSAKLDRLEDTLTAIGIGPRSKTRVVIFSERITTLGWIAAAIRDRLGMTENEVVVYHNDLADTTGQRVIEDFAMDAAKIRVLVTSDIAAEGLNLHKQCHHLIHMDLPWSLITLEQRNGRIDRYGQRIPPEIRFLTYLPEDETIASDARVIVRLAEKEHEAHLSLGDAGAILAVRSEVQEEDKIIAILRARSTEAKEAAAVATLEESPAEIDYLTFLGGRSAGTAATPFQHAKTGSEPSLFADLGSFIEEAVRAAYEDPSEAIGWETDGRVMTFCPPDDLKRRLHALPQGYVRQRNVMDRLRLTTDHGVGNHYLQDALEKHGAAGDTGTAWPEVAFVPEQHPVLDWLIDRTLFSFPRGQAPILACAVPEPFIAVQATWTNRAGEPLASEWLAAGDLDQLISFSPLTELLEYAKVTPDMTNYGWTGDPASLAAVLPKVVAAAESRLTNRKDDWAVGVNERITAHQARLDTWNAESADVIEGLTGAFKSSKRAEVERVDRNVRAILDAYQPADRPFIRVVAALVPNGKAN